MIQQTKDTGVTRRDFLRTTSTGFSALLAQYSPLVRAAQSLCAKSLPPTSEVPVYAYGAMHALTGFIANSSLLVEHFATSVPGMTKDQFEFFIAQQFFHSSDILDLAPFHRGLLDEFAALAHPSELHAHREVFNCYQNELSYMLNPILTPLPQKEPASGSARREYVHRLLHQYYSTCGRQPPELCAAEIEQGWRYLQKRWKHADSLARSSSFVEYLRSGEADNEDSIITSLLFQRDENELREFGVLVNDFTNRKLADLTPDRDAKAIYVYALSYTDHFSAYSGRMESILAQLRETFAPATSLPFDENSVAKRVLGAIQAGSFEGIFSLSPDHPLLDHMDLVNRARLELLPHARKHAKGPITRSELIEKLEASIQRLSNLGLNAPPELAGQVVSSLRDQPIAEGVQQAFEDIHQADPQRFRQSPQEGIPELRCRKLTDFEFIDFLCERGEVIARLSHVVSPPEPILFFQCWHNPIVTRRVLAHRLRPSLGELFTALLTGNESIVFPKRFRFFDTNSAAAPLPGLS